MAGVFCCTACSSAGATAPHLLPTAKASPPLASSTLVAPTTPTYEITAADSGKTFTYSVTSRFTVILDGNRYPKRALACLPEGIVGSISNIPSVAPPDYAARFEGTQPGTCHLSDGDFQVTITIAGPN